MNPTYSDAVNAAATAENAHEAALARDRVLLYVRGLDMDPLSGLELALESLRRAGSHTGQPDVRHAMEELHRLLREKGVLPELLNGERQRLSSMPPMNRHRMVAEEMDRGLVRRILKRIGRRLRARAAA